MRGPLKPKSPQNPPRRGFTFDYQEAEHFAGYNWIDGKPIFRQVVSIGPLPNGDTKGATLGTPIDWLVKCEVIGFRNAVAQEYRVVGQPRSALTAANQSSCFVTQTPPGNAAVVVETEANWADFQVAFAIVEYTKP